MNVEADDTSSPFFCPITHSTQLGQTLSIAGEPSLYSPKSLVEYLTKFKGASPTSRVPVGFGDLWVNPPGERAGVQLESMINQYLRSSDVASAASTLVGLGFSVDTPLRVPFLPIHCPPVPVIRITLLAWSVISGCMDQAELLIDVYGANINCSWSRGGPGGGNDNHKAAWASDIGVTSDTSLRDNIGYAFEEDAYARLSCLSLALDESLGEVKDDAVKWVVAHGAYVNFVHMQQAVSLQSVVRASQIQNLLLSFPTVKANYAGLNGTETTFDHILYRVLETVLRDDQEIDEHATVISMLFRIMDDHNAKGRALSSLTASGPLVMRQLHFIKSNPFRLTKWIPVTQRLLDMGAVVDTEMLQYALGTLPGDSGFPDQYRALDCRRWADGRMRWPDDTVLTLLHSVPRHIILGATNLLARAIVYARGTPVITALMHVGASRDDRYGGQTAEQWAADMGQSDTVALIKAIDDQLRSPVDITTSVAHFAHSAARRRLQLYRLT